jgi:N-acetylmuramoyl-L-alanine amidase
MKTIIIDPGHGGDKPGACCGDVLEKDVNLSIARKLAAILPDSCLTRSGDYDVPLGKRALLQRSMECAAFVSIHCDANDNPSAIGHTILFNLESKPGAELASRIHIKLVELGRRDRGCNSDTRGLAVLSQIAYPACLIECGFLSNPTERAWLLLEENQNLLAQKISEGILDYVQQ